MHSTMYSTQPAGDRLRVLATDTGPDGLASTRTLVTLEADLARRVAGQLEAMALTRVDTLYAAGRARPGQVCTVRRACIAAVLGTDMTNPAAAPAVHLASALAGAPDAARRAVADEVGRIFAGSEDIPVPVDLNDEFGDMRFTGLANVWLGEATDDELVDVLTEHDSGPLYEGLLAQMRVADPAVDEACDDQWIDVDLDVVAATAWVALHRPHLVASITE